MKLEYFFHNKSNNVNNSPKMFVHNSAWEPPDSYLPPDIESEPEKLDVLLNTIHIIKDIQNLPDLKLHALINLKNMYDIVLKMLTKAVQ